MFTFSAPTWLTSQVQNWPSRLEGNQRLLLSPQSRLALLTRADVRQLPAFVRQSPVALKYFQILGGLDWLNFPDRPFQRRWPDALPLASFAAAYLIKLDQHIVSMDHLRHYLIEHPALIWILGFPLVLDPHQAYGFDPEASLPTARHLTRLLRTLPNSKLQFLLDNTIQELKAALPSHIAFGRCISMDTKVG